MLDCLCGARQRRQGPRQFQCLKETVPGARRRLSPEWGKQASFTLTKALFGGNSFGRIFRFEDLTDRLSLDIGQGDTQKGGNGGGEIED